MANRGIDARIATKIKQRRMDEKNILKKSEDALWCCIWRGADSEELREL